MRKRLESEVRRGQIAEAALAPVLSGGTSALTVKNIARQVGVTPPALYRHYADKTEILAAVVDHIISVYSASHGRVLRETDGPVAQLKALFFSHVRLFERHPAVPVLFYSDLFWREEPTLGERLNLHLEEFGAKVGQVIRRGQAQGSIRDDETPEALFTAYLGLFSSLGMLAARGLCHVDMSVQAGINWKIFQAYIIDTAGRPGQAAAQRDNCEVVP